MSSFLSFLSTFVIYLGLLITWFIINLVLYFLAVVLKKRVFINAVYGLSAIVMILVNTIISLLIFIYMIILLFDGQWLQFILLFFIGGALIKGFFSFIQFPFVIISGYFSEKVGKLDFNENIEKAEIIDEKGKVVGVSEGNTTITRRLAMYFLLFYSLNIISELLGQSPESKYYGLRWFIETPFTQIIGGTIMIGIPYIIYHKLKYKSFFPSDKRYFFIQVWKLNLIIFGVLVLLLTIFK